MSKCLWSDARENKGGFAPFPVVYGLNHDRDAGPNWPVRPAVIGWLCTLLMLLVGDFGGFAATTEDSPSITVEQMGEVLARPILERDTTLKETQRFCESRIAVLPKFSQASDWEKYAGELRQKILEQIVLRGVPAEWKEHQVRVEWLDWVPTASGYRLRKLRYEALPGLWIPALLYLPERIEGKRPAVLHVNGHTPLGKQFPPKQLRCINLAKKGVIGLNIEWVGMGQLSGPGYNHARMQQLDLCGVSGLSVFWYNMQRGLDVLLQLEEVDPTRLGVTGLSGGGWQTITLSALDPRVALANPVAGYSSYRTRLYHFKDLGESEQTPSDLAALADYTHLTALMAPRPLLLTYNSKDECCFESGYALTPLVEAAQPIYELLGRGESLRTHVNHDPGTHNYERENREAFYQFVKDFFFGGNSSFDPAEIPSEGEIKSAEELVVPLPENNEDFQSLAKKFAAHLPSRPSGPQEPKTLGAEEYRKALRQCLHFASSTCRGECVEERQVGDYTVRFWKLSVNDEWTIPAVEWTPLNSASSGENAPLTLIADTGRKGLAEKLARYLKSGTPVLVFDPFYVGETSFPSHGWLFAILVAGVGERPLGVQSGQVAAVARWWGQVAGRPPRLEAVGPRTSLMALCAAAADPGTVKEVTLVNSLASLKEIIERNWTAADNPELFCFGLLAVTDIPQLVSLCREANTVVTQAGQ